MAMSNPVRLAGLLIAAAVLIVVVANWGGRDGVEPSSSSAVGTVERQSAGGPAAPDADPGAGSGSVVDPLRGPDQADVATQTGGVNPTIDRYGVPVSTSFPVQSVAEGEQLTFDRLGPTSPKSSIADAQAEELQGPDAFGSMSPESAPEAGSPQYIGLAPEASDPGIIGLAPEASDPGVMGPAPEASGAGIQGPGPGDAGVGTPTTPPESQ